MKPERFALGPVADTEGAVDAGTIPLRSQEDVVRLRQRVRDLAVANGFGLVDQTKIITAASELARNTVLHGGGGSVSVSVVQRGARPGLCLSFEDRGPGIADIGLAMTDGYTSGGGLGLGLSGAKRLTDEFSIDSVPGEGTRIVIVKCRR